tara:strand:+ start:843 stop:2246 length:1404 start_codon:yes stop_codon:yes gene_type:complete
LEIFIASLSLLIFWIRLFFNPYLLNNILFIINIPMSLFVGIGMLMFSFGSSDIYIEYDRKLYSDLSISLSYYGFAIYFIFINLLTYLKINIFSLPKNREFNEQKNFKNIINFSNFLFFIAIILCIPFWLSIDIKDTGLYTLFFDTVRHALQREKTIKLAESSFLLTLYSYGKIVASISSPLILFQILISRNKYSIFKSIFKLILLSLISNINGSRFGFFEYLIIPLFTMFILDINQIRSKLSFDFKFLFKNLKFKIRLINLLLKFFLFTGLFILTFGLISLAAGGRILETAFLALDFLFLALINRIFAATFYTGIMNIMFFDKLDLSFLNYLGGFPLVSLFIGERESMFRIIGRASDEYFFGLYDTTTTLNTSGLFINLAVWGISGTFLYIFNICFNLYVYHVLLNNIKHYFPAMVATSQIIFTWVLAFMSISMPNSGISIFPMTWIFSLLLIVFYGFFIKSSKISY